MIYVVLLILLFCIVIVLYMVKEAFENHVLYHEVQLNGEADNLTLFFISDIHVRKVNETMIKSISKKVDAVIIGGDLADKRTPIHRIYDNLKILKSLGPTYFVWGNNDREVGESRLRQIFKETEVEVIENDSVLLEGCEKVQLCAVDFSTTNDAPFHQTFEKCEKEDVIIFIAHNPQLFPTVLKRYNVDFLMGGHLHGGQIRIGPLGIHPHGSFSNLDSVPTLISNGYGTTLLPMRFFAKPQCHIIDVKFKGYISNE